MKIAKYGIVILSEQRVQVEGWLVTKEDSDPVEATTEQMLLEVAIPWAQKKLNDAIMQELQKVAGLRKAAAAQINPTGEANGQSN